MASSQKFQAGGTGKTGVISSGKTFVKPASTPAPTTKVNVGGVLIETPVYSEGPAPRMASPGSGGGSSENIPETAETFATVETSTGFNWTYVIIGLVAVVVLFFVFKKK